MNNEYWIVKWVVEERRGRNENYIPSIHSIFIRGTSNERKKTNIKTKPNAKKSDVVLSLHKTPNTRNIKLVYGVPYGLILWQHENKSEQTKKNYIYNTMNFIWFSFNSFVWREIPKKVIDSTIKYLQLWYVKGLWKAKTINRYGFFRTVEISICWMNKIERKMRKKM